MKQLPLIIFFLSWSSTTLAQSEIKIDLDQWKGKKESIPFDISSVQDNRTKPELIGSLQVGKNKSKNILFMKNSAIMIQEFVDKQFKKGKETTIRMEIEKLDIAEVVMKKKRRVSVFIFACKFYKENSTLTTPLYTFNARNTIPKKNALKMAITNYVGRAISAAILNFKKSYQKHPEWKKENINAPTVKIDKSIYFNQFERNGDTIALDGTYKLKPADFAGIIGEEEQDHAYSYFMMTYRLEHIDETDKITLKVFPKVFFLRSKSWAKKSGTIDWLQHQQLLMDLAAYHGLQFKKALEERSFSAGYYKTEINRIYNEISMKYFNEMDQLQAETKFGSNRQKEELWKKKVDKYLGRL